MSEIATVWMSSPSTPAIGTGVTTALSFLSAWIQASSDAIPFFEW